MFKIKNNLIDLIKNDKKTKMLIAMTILLIFIFLIGTSLALFTKTYNNKAANIKVNNLLFNITTNSGTSDDRILHLKTGKTETFNVVITNLNKINSKFELLYDICSNSTCTSTVSSLPTGVSIGLNPNIDSVVSGTISPGTSNKKTIYLMTENTSSADVYIRLKMNAGYTWNSLTLKNQIQIFQKKVEFVKYIDGTENTDIPLGCNFSVTPKAYNASGTEITSSSGVTVTCDARTNTWKTSFKNFPNKIALYFVSLKVATFEYIAPTTSNTTPYYTYIVPKTGTYKLEVWGAQGADSSNATGGYGGYSYGNMQLTKGTTLYIYIGGNSPRNEAGYNGGGIGQYQAGTSTKVGGGGGGATHIATKTGLLSTLSSSLSNILIVSGGGGGAGEYNGRLGGAAGGIQGNSGVGACYIPTGGTQTAGGTNGDNDGTNAAFGLGGGAPNGTTTSGTWGAGGGGGGYYGGGAASYKTGGNCGAGGAGGSGYIGNSSLSNKSMYCYNCTESTVATTKTVTTTCHNATPTENCSKEGYGYARITLVS